jgi:hypothetical protein
MFNLCYSCLHVLDNSDFSWNSLQFVILEGILQISGKPDVAKRALYEVSTLLHQNPRKDKSPLNFAMPFGGQGFHPPGAPMPSMLPPGNPMWSHRNPSSHGMPPTPWMEGYGNQHSRFVPGGFNDVPPGPGAEASAEFSMKILCSAGKIGGVIGKGGSNVKQLQQETGASIHVQDASAESDERVIRVSAFEVCLFCCTSTISLSLSLLHLFIWFISITHMDILLYIDYWVSMRFYCCQYTSGGSLYLYCFRLSGIQDQKPLKQFFSFRIKLVNTLKKVISLLGFLSRQVRLVAFLVKEVMLLMR